MDRREFMKSAALFGAACYILPAGCVFGRAHDARKVVVLGIDGLDPHLVAEYMAQGVLPNLQRLWKAGAFVPVLSSDPPQSPVAWSNFSVGAPPAVHGIYDFIHRDPATMSPYLSTSRVVPPDRTLNIGGISVPVSGGGVEQLRRGQPFWELLAERDIPATVFKMPANFPCENDRVDMVSGMGTPDLRGGYGSYSLYTTNREAFADHLTGGKVIPVSFHNGRMDTVLDGPVNSFKADAPESNVPLTVWRDRDRAVARIRLQDTELILNEGEWTDWLQVSFPMLGSMVSVSGICKLHLKQVHPHFALYVAPLNIDPSDPALPVVSSSSYGKKLVQANGLFCTQGLPDNTKALSEGVLSDREYLDLAHQILDERLRMMDYELGRFQRRGGLLFYYISSVDQNTHMFWRLRDRSHPMFDRDLQQQLDDPLREFYRQADVAVGKVLQTVDINDPDVTCMVMSDHGFAAFSREVNLNTWLYENGYLALRTRQGLESAEMFANVNWQRTGAYNLGINCLYLNRYGREKDGVVMGAQASGLLDNLRRDMLAMRDPQTGRTAVSRVTVLSDAEKERQPHAPDIIVGWSRGFRNSWSSILGGFTRNVFQDNCDKWSGDHCIDHQLVPAVLFANRPVAVRQPALHDITATVLHCFDIEPPGQMAGRPFFAARKS